MKEIILFHLFLVLVLTQVSFAYDPECMLPPFYSSLNEKTEVERTVLRIDDVFIFIDLYTIKLKGFENPYSKTHYQNLVNHLSREWEVLDEKQIDIDDIVTPDGRLKKYVLIDIGASVLDNYLFPLQDLTALRTCVDKGEDEEIYLLESRNYDEIFVRIEEYFIPKLTQIKIPGEIK